jgi:hypothetical protein
VEDPSCFLDRVSASRLCSKLNLIPEGNRAVGQNDQVTILEMFIKGEL